MTNFLDRLKHLRSLDRRVYTALVRAADTLDQAADIIEDRDGDTDGECAQSREDTRELRALIREFAEVHNVFTAEILKADLDEVQADFDCARRKIRDEKGKGFASTYEDWEKDHGLDKVSFAVMAAQAALKHAGFSRLAAGLGPSASKAFMKSVHHMMSHAPLCLSLDMLDGTARAAKAMERLLVLVDPPKEPT